MCHQIILKSAVANQGCGGNSVTTDITNADDDTALEELHDALARVKAQTHVVRLAMSGMEDERDIRAIVKPQHRSAHRRLSLQITRRKSHSRVCHHHLSLPLRTRPNRA